MDTMAKYAHALGLGEKTNIELMGEVPGLIPNSDWKVRTFGEPWQPGENLSNAVGQGFILANLLQMTVAYTGIGTGKIYKPFLIKEILDNDNRPVSQFHPQLLRDLEQTSDSYTHISAETFKTVREGLRLVSNGERGTAKWWKIPGVEIAGKTGTAQIMSVSADEIYDKCEQKPLRNRHHGWFIGYAPANNPVISVGVFAEHACHGSTGAAPIVRDVIRAYIQKYHPEMIKLVEAQIAIKAVPAPILEGDE
jgi:penicillin-binding protein 2